MADRNEDRWHVGREIPLALIITIACQTGAGIWWMAGINERVNMLEKAQAISAVVTPTNADRLTRVESSAVSMQRDLTEIKADVKSLITISRPTNTR